MHLALKILSSAGLLLSASLSQCAAAQGVTLGDPFVRGAPPQSLPELSPLPATSGQSGLGRSGLGQSVLTQPPPAPQTGSQTGAAPASSALPSLSAPRVYSEGSQTKVVYDLPAGVSYTLIPGFSGLRLDFRGLRAAPSITAQLGASVGEYRVATSPGGAQVSLATPYALGLRSGWRASETVIASGGRVLILEFGPGMSGGALTSVRGEVRGDQVVNPAPTNLVPLSPITLTAPGPDGGPGSVNPNAISLSRSARPTIPAGLGLTSQSSADAASGSVLGLADPAPGLNTGGLNTGSSAGQLPPGDAPGNASGPLPAPAVGLPGAGDSDPNVLRGQASGAALPGALLAAPRIGKNPGVTRVVLDLPPGTSFVITPGALGLSIDLTGVGVNPQTSDVISSELRGWRYGAVGTRSNVFLMTASPLNVHSGWRSVLLPPASGSDRSRLAIDLSPAFANTTRLTPAERVLAAVPPMRSGALAFSGAALVAPSVVIDPGHGGRDPGAVGTVTEKAVVLDVALRVRQYLQSAGITVIMSRDTDRELLPNKNADLNARAALGYNGAQLFLSIHANSMEPANVLRGYGIETWWNNNNAASSTFANVLQNNVIQTTGAFSQGLKSGRSLAVLRGSKVPAALIEIGFVGHPVDGGNLLDDNYLERVALGIARGIREALMTGVGAK
ncbi:N-acetylmuramoyl-L-alanine amidase [Deinococcus rubellus]|uniref:N-acetylmuramoyl-L-alanine amidase n=1 Tax=Deinococcus rubellus TaxID=1889240 RepID=A0ABY5YHY6_9DEIO|nr:N-acetylmuramoyl-L-alanine amidase [Deinococcus rubellus]UWX63982.1 N-acetylmuramoyl-L-alanine amidase [Deinococcus rubellus]